MKSNEELQEQEFAWVEDSNIVGDSTPGTDTTLTIADYSMFKDTLLMSLHPRKESFGEHFPYRSASLVKCFSHVIYRIFNSSQNLDGHDQEVHFGTLYDLMLDVIEPLEPRN